jgi:hypothetical protein
MTIISCPRSPRYRTAQITRKTEARFTRCTLCHRLAVRRPQTHIPTFATTPTATANAINNTTTDNTKAKFLVGEGGVAESTEVVLEYPMLTEKVVERDYQLVFNIKNLVQTQYDFLLQVQCGNIDLTFYYASGMEANQWVYGKQGGIVPRKVTVSFPKGAGKDDRDIAIIKIDWKATGDPDRRINPIA